MGNTPSLTAPEADDGPSPRSQRKANQCLFAGAGEFTRVFSGLAATHLSYSVPFDGAGEFTMHSELVKAKR
jgi:hypothetical protein